MTNTKQEQGNPYLIPMSIAIAGLFIGLGIFFSGTDATGNPTSVQRQPSDQGAPGGQKSSDNIRQVTKDDHIRGNIDAPVKIVEYSDFECPFCKRIHPTLKQIVDEYDGKVAWVYRQFPLDSLHPVKARLEAVTSECVADIGGNDAFWQFTDRFFELTPSNNRTDLDIVLPQIIGELGLSQSAIDECVASGKFDQHIQEDVNNAIATGGRGTPWSVIIAPNGKTFPVSGALPFQSFKATIDIALEEK